MKLFQTLSLIVPSASARELALIGALMDGLDGTARIGLALLYRRCAWRWHDEPSGVEGIFQSPQILSITLNTHTTFTTHNGIPQYKRSVESRSVYVAGRDSGYEHQWTRGH